MTRSITKKKKQAGSEAAPQHVTPPSALIEGSSEPTLQAQKETPALRASELEQQALLAKRQAEEAANESARLREQLGEAQRQVRVLSAELSDLREVYQCVGPGTLAAANRFDALKRKAPWLLSPITVLARAL